MSTTIIEVVEEIVGNVNEQARVWQRLLDLSMVQRTALEQQNAPMVHAVLQEIEMAMLDRSRAEVRRAMLLRQAASLLGIEADDITRDVIVGCCPAELAQRLEQASDELRALVVELDAVVGYNAAMLEQELSIIELLVEGATIDVAVRPTYGKQGMASEAPRLRLLDAQA